ncbi:mucosa-associated lymphoid tissue lymphoma translocation protein 1 isoform X1 [Xyrauchen texanus]|uniref:mucosa-associated lymphoid tissue lymphoma translocation protein 1 isoform X1 n=1 Tax=Xyrauchen texanus TaxID=154827 RepID=UPI002242B6F1|nr:mucosa-associated lymphoid tissue lymphoma translocation protein 1 isoform X1 [Xyrauchen texanus]XP_051980855.1 mucosa-associated lymphoid tissue lymphoma translocation protein 1 isoform X1 [Xyrauchen texanus]
MSDLNDNSLNINLLKESVLKRLSESLDKANSKGWRKLGEIVKSDKRFKVSLDDMDMCSLKVLEIDGSPSRTLLKLIGDKGCMLGDLVEFLQIMDQTDALQCLKPSGIQILVQPLSVSVIAGHNLRLSCCAVSASHVQYQWFKKTVEVPNSFSADLVFSPVQVRDSGFYICRVNSGNTYEFSHWAQVDVLDVPPRYGLVSLVSEGRPKVVIQPQPQRLLVGDSLNLECGAIGRPLPQYQWYRNGVPIKKAIKRKYTVDLLLPEHRGRYRCEIFCNNERTWSNEVDVIIENPCHPEMKEKRISPEISGAMECSEDDFLTNEQDYSFEKPYATDKVALLIGNLTYRNHPQLKAPMVDVYDLTNLLRQLNFKVVSLLDLTESEMRNAVEEFLSLLHKGVYGLLYYAGHGYENFGNSFMVPVDAPNPYRSGNCLCVQSILKLMQEKETGLNVFLLDMCRKRNLHDEAMPNVMLKVTANIVFGYATCQDAEAFELSSSGFTNGVFIKFLKKRLLEDEKITVLLDSVAEDMGQFDPTKGKQALEIRSSLSERRSLTDPIRPGDYSDPTQAHNLLWSKAHELPENRILDFECGVQIKMDFAAEFSNVLVIYTSIVKKPEEMMSCQAHITNLPLDLDVDPKLMNKETLEETGSFLLSGSVPQHCLYTRLSSIQKLKEELAFTVCLQVLFNTLEDLVQWNMDVNIGKPLTAKLDLNRPTLKLNCPLTCHMPHSPSTSPSHSPASDCRFHSQEPNFPQQYANPYLNVCEPLHGAVGGYRGFQMHAGHTYQYESMPYSTFLTPPSIPIETTDDIDDMQNEFMNSLQLYNHP